MKKQRNKYLQEVKQFNDKLKDPKYNSSERFYEFYTATVRYAVFPISWHSFYVNQLVTQRYTSAYARACAQIPCAHENVGIYRSVVCKNNQCAYNLLRK